jgi:quercetin dioxygenase-like cupin family protein
MHVQDFGRGAATLLPRPGCHNVSCAMIANQADGIVVCLYFEPHGTIDEHRAPKSILFTVVSGRGFVKVGDEVSPMGAGQAVEWPAGVSHLAWTENEAMTAILVDPVREGPIRWSAGV